MKVNKEDQQKLEASSALAWTLFNDFKTETGDKLEVHDRKYLVDVFEDNSKSIAIKKSSQVAFSTTFIIKCFHLAYFNKMNIAFTLPTNKIVQDFVKPKVNPLVLQNPTIGKIITEDSQTLKKVGSNFIYFRGSWGEREAITISLDLICADEYDRCFTDSDVEILTKSGWKKIDQVTTEDYIPSLHPKRRNVSYKKPKRAIKVPYKGYVYRFKGRSIDFEVTENHKIWARINHPDGTQPYKLHKAKDLYGKKFVLASNGFWPYKGKTPHLVSLPYVNRLRKVAHDTRKNQRESRIFYSRKVSAKAWYSFLGWYLAEGNIIYQRNSKKHKKATGCVVITQQNEKNVEEIKNVIRELGYKPRVYNNKVNNVKSIRFTDQQVSFYLQKLGLAHEKYIPKRWIWNCHKKYLNYLLDALIKGDGDDRGVISTTSKRLADDIQIVAIRASKSATIKKQKRSRANWRDIYRVTINERRYRRFNGFMGSSGKATVTKKYKECTAYCIDIPPHRTFLFRKNGSLPFWSGNSATSVLEIYKSRLKASKYRWFWRFSNPSIPLGGVDFYWSTSDKKEWFMLCKHCGHRSFATWEQRERYKTHFVDVDKSVLICGKCGKSLSDEDRRDGEWVAEYPNKKISGYHLSHLICPWISIEEIIEESHGSPTYFHNFILGEPYVTKDLAITRETIVNCVAPNRPKDVVQWFMGVDQKAGPKHWCIGCITKNGQKWIRGYGMTRSWDDIERLRNERDAIMVCDAQPYQTIPKKLSKKYPGRVFLNWYKEDTKNVGVVRWGRSSPAAPLETHKVFADRTGIFDELVYSLNNREVLYSMSLPQLEDYIGHLTVMYRAQIEQPERAPGAESEKKAAWVCPTGQADDWAHATVYVLIGMTRAILQSGRSVKFRSPETEKDSDKVWHVQPDQTITRPEMNILEMLKKKRKKRGKHWMYK